MAAGAEANQGKTAEELRLDEVRAQGVPWKSWGPDLCERQWGYGARGLQRGRRCPLIYEISLQISPYPYNNLIEENRRRGGNDPEHELIDTGIFDEDRYFDVFVEYAKVWPNDVLIQISVANRGPEAAALHVLPTLWLRNTWTWWPDQPKPSIMEARGEAGIGMIHPSHAALGDYRLPADHRASANLRRR